MEKKTFVDWTNEYLFLTLSVPDEGYLSIFWLGAYLMKVISASFDLERTWWRLFQNRLTWSVPDEGFSESFDLERTWWRFFRIFWLYLMKVFQIFCLRAYLMKVFQNLLTWNVPDEGCFRNVSWALNLISTF